MVALRKYAVAAVLLANIAVVARSSALGLGDNSNHLARAYIMADLIFHHGVQFGAQFQYHFLAVPYILPDLLLTSAVALLGARTAVALWTVLIFLSIPAALVFYFRVTAGVSGKALLTDERASFLLLCALYLSTNFFFVVGFFAFQLGLACVIVAAAIIELLRRRWTNGWFALYCVLIVAAYLIHLSTLPFLATIVGVSAVLRLSLRSSSLRHELLLAAPILGVLAWHFGAAEHYHRATDLSSMSYYWGTLRGKALGALRNFHRYGGLLDRALTLLYAASLLALILERLRRDTFASRRLIETFALAIAFVGMYFVLPFSYSEATYVDLRALALAQLFVLLGCCSIPRRESLPRRGPAFATALALVLAILNVAYLGKHFAALSRWSNSYRALFAAIPRRARVLPLYTVPAIWHYMDPSPGVIIYRNAFIPYLFSATLGDPMIYFRYLDPPYTPPDDWYIRAIPLTASDWRRIACTYQYILAARPFDSGRIRVATHPIAATSSAALLAMDPSACGAPPVATGNRLQ